jgi:hypothetical protein
MEELLMSRVRVGLLSLLAVLAVSAAMSASASAHEWKINGTVVNTSLAVTSTGGAFQLLAGAIEVKCTGVTDKGTVNKGGVDEATEIKFTGCTTNEVGCLVKSAGAPAKAGEIIVQSIPTLLVTGKTSTGTEVLTDEFKQKANGEFVTLETGKKEIAGNNLTELCTNFPHTSKVTGHVAAIVENSTQTLNFPNPELQGNTLVAFGKNAKLFGTDKQALVKGGTLTGV